MTATPALRIAAAYVLLASLWIGFSDLLVRDVASLLPGDPVRNLTVLEIAKGWLFVAVTGFLLFGLLRVTFLGLLREEAAHRSAEERMAGLLANLPHGVDEVDRDGIILYTNPSRAAMLGYAPGELIGRRLWELVPSGEQAAFEAYFRRMVAEMPEPAAWEGPNRCRNGDLVTVRADWSYLRAPDGTLEGFTAIITDVTAQRRAETEVAEAAAVFGAAAEAIVLADHAGRIRRVNRAFTDLSGFSEGDAVGRTAELLRPALPGGRPLSLIREALATHNRWQGEIVIGARQGPSIPGWASITAARRAPDSIYYIALFTDLRALKESERQLEKATYYDPLTGLPNRVMFEAHLAHALDRIRDSAGRAAVLALNIERFKEINDSLGPETGDAILRELGHRLRAALKIADTVAHAGGDRFLILLEETGPGNEVAATAERLLAAIATPFHVNGREVFCTGGVGIALFPTDGSDAATLERNAETAMYRSRGEGGAYQFYSPEFTARAFERWTMETSLRRAVENDELQLHYQPQLDRDGKLIACEALVRWRHPQFGLVSPDRFIPLAEETGLIVGIGRWVLLEACRQARSWRDRGLDLRVAVNISGREFSRPDLIQHVTTAAADTLPPAKLELEITESVFMSRTDATLANLGALRSLGFCLAIDDFGTGYSSLSYLQRFPVDRLKVDQSFVRGVPENSGDAAIVRAVVALGHSLRLRVIAEGVETEAQSRFLAGADCDEFQGFRFSPPLPADEFFAWARAREGG